MTENSLGAPEDDSWHEGAALKLRAALKERGELLNLQKAIQTERFWEFQHFSFGMGVRNWLRSNGFDEKAMNVWNLDDHYIPIMVMAAGFKFAGGYDHWTPFSEIPKKLVPINDKRHSNSTKPNTPAQSPQSPSAK